MRHHQPAHQQVMPRELRVSLQAMLLARLQDLASSLD